jgi:microcompartment protein CcmK/EutM
MVASRKEPSMEGLKFLVVRHLDVDDNDLGSFVVAADAVGAGVGEVVLCDAVVMAIVDTWEVGGEEKFRK